MGAGRTVPALVRAEDEALQQRIDMAPPEKPEKPEPESPKREQRDWVQAMQDALKKKKAGGGFPEPRGRYGNKKTRKP
jgi:hypothetical protein